jgi:hypothetical protein
MWAFGDASTTTCALGQMVKGHTGDLRRGAFGLEGRGSLINIARSYGPFEPLARSAAPRVPTPV